MDLDEKMFVVAVAARATTGPVLQPAELPVHAQPAAEALQERADISQ